MVQLMPSCCVSWEKSHWNSILNRFPLNTFLHCFSVLFTFVTFLIQWPLSPVGYCIPWCRSCRVCSGLTYELYSGCDPSLYPNCVVCYRLLAVPCVWSVGCVFEHIHTLDVLECPWTLSCLCYPMIFLNVVDVYLSICKVF